MTPTFRSHMRRLAAPAALLALGLTCISGHKAFAAADPNASPAVQNEIGYIASIRNQNLVLSMQQIGNPWHVDDMQTNPPGEKMSEITHVNQMTGKYPAIVGEDWINCDAYSDHQTSIINLAKNYKNLGGLVEFSWHEGRPSAYSPDGAGASSALLSSGEWNDLLNVPSSATHQNWQHHMDLLAGWMGQLQSAGVVVLWRPYHEGDGNWFWWGASPANYRALWRMQFNYLTNTKGLHNLIWVISTPNASYYPGVNYVDIGGMDIYSGSKTDSVYSTQNGIVVGAAPGQPAALTECGLLPDTNYIHTINYAWANVWCGGWLDPGYYGATGGTNNSLTDIQNFYNDGRTVNLNSVAIPTPAFSANTWYRFVNNNSIKVIGVSGMSTTAGASAVQYDDNGTIDHNWRFVQLPNGGYHIINQNSGLVLGVAGASTASNAGIVQWTDNGAIDHNWDIVPQGNGRYHIVNQNSGLLLGVAGASTANNAGIVQWGDNGSNDHNWAIVPVGSPIASGHRYHIVNAHSGLFLDNPNGTNVAGTWLQQFVNTYSPAQEWVMTNVSGDLWTIVNYAGGLAMDDYGWSTTAGTRMDEWTFNGAAVQQFHIVAVGDGTYKIVSAVSNLPVEIQSASAANGGAVGQWTDNGNACQHWTFQFVN